MTPPPDGHYCPQCGARLDDARLVKHPTTRFCSRRCAFAYRKAHPELYVKQRVATAKANRRRWAEWKATNEPAPPHTDAANEKRGDKIAKSNRGQDVGQCLCVNYFQSSNS